MRASNVLPFPLYGRAMREPFAFPAMRRQTALLMMPFREPMRPKRRLFDEFDIWSRRLGRLVAGAVPWRQD